MPASTSTSEPTEQIAEAASVTTAAGLQRLPTGMGKRYELVVGELHTMSPAGSEHGLITAEVAYALVGYVKSHPESGKVYGAETGFWISRDPDTVRAPDAAFVSAARMPETLPPGFFEGPPDLVVEVVSPSDTFSEVDAKTAMWLASGARLVWVVVPETRAVHVHRAGSDAAVTRHEGDTLDGGDVLPDFTCPVADLFPSAPR